MGTHTIKKGGACVVLEGGGVKCAYQYGALRALEKRYGSVRAAVSALTGEELGGFAGSSFGALGSAVMLAGGTDALQDLWNAVLTEGVFRDPGIAGVLEGAFRRRLPRDIPSAARLFWLFAEPSACMRDVSRRYYDFVAGRVDEGAARRSGLALGLTAVELFDAEDLRGVCRLREFDLDGIEEGLLPDCVAASAAFPLLRPKRIGAKLFSDGGILDNIPVSMMEKRGFTSALVIRACSSEPKIRWTRGIRVGAIAPSRPLGSPALFTGDNVREMIALGEHDALRTRPFDG